MKKKIGYSICLLLSLFTLPRVLTQQPPKTARPHITITGTVIDTTGRRVEGASVTAPGKRVSARAPTSMAGCLRCGSSSSGY